MATGEGSDQLEVKDKGRLRFLDYASHFSFGGLPKKFPIEYFLRLPEISFYGCAFSKLTSIFKLLPLGEKSHSVLAEGGKLAQDRATAFWITCLLSLSNRHHRQHQQ